MTVSPNRPQDGNPLHKVEGSGVELSDRSRAASLPPTLFKLPNLGASTRSTASKDPEIESQDEVGPNLFAEPARGGLGSPAVSNQIPARTSHQPAASANRRDLAPEVQLPVGEETETRSPANHFRGATLLGQHGSDHPSDRSIVAADPVDDSITIPGPPDLASVLHGPDDSVNRPATISPTQSSPLPRTSASDVPAGRTWMESLGSHGVVIVLLLVVVAAALLTGQGEEDPTSQSLSTQSELLNFDELNVDLPLPANNPAITVAESQVSAIGNSSSLPAADSMITAVPPAVPANIALPAEAAAASASMIEATPPPAQGNPVVSLDAPRPAAESGLDHEFNSGFLPNGVQANQFVTPQAGVDALPVAVRTEVVEADTPLPSLEQLEGLHERPAQTSATPVGPTRLLSRTPVGIPDWSQYIPKDAPQVDVAVEPEAGTSSSSNQVVQP